MLDRKFVSAVQFFDEFFGFEHRFLFFCYFVVKNLYKFVNECFNKWLILLTKPWVKRKNVNQKCWINTFFIKITVRTCTLGDLNFQFQKKSWAHLIWFCTFRKVEKMFVFNISVLQNEFSLLFDFLEHQRTSNIQYYHGTVCVSSLIKLIGKSVNFNILVV